MHKLYWTLSFLFQHVLCTYMVFRNATTRQKKHPFLVNYCNQRHYSGMIFKFNLWKLSSVDFMKATHQHNNNITEFKETNYVFSGLFLSWYDESNLSKDWQSTLVSPTPLFNCLSRMPPKYDYIRHKTLTNAWIPLQLL